MKKIIFTITIIITMAFTASAQTDGFFNAGAGDYSGDGGRISTGTMPLLPQGGVGVEYGDQTATVPLGSGLLILTALGGAYALRKKE